ncbi:MAG: T9SS type A sorting domain-containing protein [Bacteroidota bacterium]
MLLKTGLIFAIGFYSSIHILAQTNVDICLHKADGYWQCALRPQSDVDGLISNIQFSLATIAGAAQIDSIVQKGLAPVYLPLEKAGQAEEDNGLLYQKVAGFGLISLDSLDVSWTGANWTAICNIYLSDTTAQLWLKVDQWTETNNGSYYLEWNGEDHTGEIKSKCPLTTFTGFEEEINSSPWTVYPNPFDGQTQLLSKESSFLFLELTDLSGKVVWTNRRRIEAEQSTTLDFDFLPSGVWLLRVRNQENLANFRLITY